MSLEVAQQQQQLPREDEIKEQVTIIEMRLQTVEEADTVEDDTWPWRIRD